MQKKKYYLEYIELTVHLRMCDKKKNYFFLQANLKQLFYILSLIVNESISNYYTIHIAYSP